MNSSVSSPLTTGRRHGSPLSMRARSQRRTLSLGRSWRIGARNTRTATRRRTAQRHIRRHARRTRRIQQGSRRGLRPRQPPPRASHHPRRRPGPRDLCGPFGTGRARRRRAHYRRTRPGLGPQPDRERARRRLDRYATGRGLRYSRVGTTLMLAAPTEQRLADAIDTVAAAAIGAGAASPT